MRRHCAGRSIAAATMVLFLCAVVRSADGMPSSARIPFVQNEGQFEENVLFTANTLGGSTVYVARDGAVAYVLPGAEGKGWCLLERIGTPRDAARGIERAETVVNYFRGSDPARWRKGTTAWQGVDLGRRFEGVDVELRARGNNVEKLFTVAPGASPAAIRVVVEGAAALRVAGNGELIVDTPRGEIRYTAPVAFQDLPDGRRMVDVAYCVQEDAYGFAVGAYDPTQPLVIDPLLAGTYLGGTDMDYLEGLAVATNGDVYVVGETRSTNFPTTAGAYDTVTNGTTDIYLSRFDSNLTTLRASTFLGGSGQDLAGDIVLHSNGSVYVAGQTYSTNFPVTAGAFSNRNPSVSSSYGSCIIVRFDAGLSNLLASTYLGGSSNDWSVALKVASNGDLLIAGGTESANFPATAGAFDTTQNGNFDVFVARMHASLSNLVAATLLGGEFIERVNDMMVAPDGRIYVAGQTYSTNFVVTAGAYVTNLPTYGVEVGFLTSFHASLSNVLASTMCATNYSPAGALVWGADGSIYAGVNHVQAKLFPGASGYSNGTNQASGNLSVAKFDAGLSNVLAEAVVASPADEVIAALAQAPSGWIYLAGRTKTTWFPTLTNSFDRTYYNYLGTAADCGVLAAFDGDLSDLTASTYIGVSELNCLMVDSSGTVWFAGESYLTEGITNLAPTLSNSYDRVQNGHDSYIGRLDGALSGPTLSITNMPTCDERSPSQTNKLTFHIALSGPAAHPVTFVMATSNGTATSGSDYVATYTTGTLVRGQVSTSIAVTVNGDWMYETNETMFLNLSDISGQVMPGTVSAQGTILNDDSPPLLVYEGSNLVVEGHAGTNWIPFVFQHSGGVSSDIPGSVELVMVDGSATDGSDYIGTNVLFDLPPYQNAVTTWVGIVGDRHYSTNEHFNFYLTNAVNRSLDSGVLWRTLTISNDDPRPYVLINYRQIYESDVGVSSNVVCPIVVTNSSEEAISFALFTSNSLLQPVPEYVNYLPTNQTYVVPARQSNSTFTFTFTLMNDDCWIGPNWFGEFWFVTTPEWNLGPIQAYGADLPRLQLLDVDDEPTGQPRVQIGAISAITNYEGSSGFTDVSITLGHDDHCTYGPISIRWEIRDGTGPSNNATSADSDFVPTNRVINFPVGVLQTTVVARIRGDAKVETDETFILAVSAATNCTGSTNQNLVIRNDDYGEVRVSDVTVNEGNSGTTAMVFNVTLTTSILYTATMDFMTVDGTAVAGGDYTATNGSLTFPPGTTSLTVTVYANGDTAQEVNETFQFTVYNLVNASPLDTSGTGTIVNDDLPTISIGDAGRAEGDVGTNAMVFTVSLNTPSVTNVWFQWYSSQLTAQENVDYAFSYGTVTMEVAQVSTTLPVNVFGDLTRENDETFQVFVWNVNGALEGDVQATGTITNDDFYPFISIGGVTNLEGNSGTTAFDLPVTLSFAFTADVSCSFITVDGTATAAGGDYAATNGSLTIPAGQVQGTARVWVNGDTTVEPGETFRVTLAALSNALAGATNATCVIRPDDGAVFNIGSVTNYEGNSGTNVWLVPVTLQQSQPSNVTFVYTTQLGFGTATPDWGFPPPGDYFNTNGTGTILAGTTGTSVAVRVTGNTTAESDEYFYVDVTSVSGTVSDVTQAQVWILNDDGPIVFVNDITTNEGNSGWNLSIPVYRTGDVSQAASVSWRADPGTAAYGSDYNATTGTLSFMFGSTVTTFSVWISGDTMLEADEYFTVQLYNLSGVRPGRTNATITLLNDGDTMFLDILQTNQVTYNTTINLSGVASNLVGTLTCSNFTAGSAAIIQPFSNDWSFAGVPLVLGSNTVYVYGTNAAMQFAWDTIEVYREAAVMWTLTVSPPPYGTPSPAGVTTNTQGSVVTCTAGGPVTMGLTQYVCVGWTLTGQGPASGTSNAFSLTAAADAVLTWLWGTNYWLETVGTTNGAVSPTSSWRTAHQNVEVTAVPEDYHSFTNWTGDVPGGQETNNPVTVLVDLPKSLTAWFYPNVTTNTSTPEWWLADYGLTNEFPEEAEDDHDGDGMDSWEEYVAGCDPTNPASRLVIVELDWVHGTNYTEYVSDGETQRIYEVIGHPVKWPSVAGRVYDIVQTTNLVTGPWWLVDGATNIPANPPYNSYTNFTPTYRNKDMMYRVRVRLE